VAEDKSVKVADLGWRTILLDCQVWIKSNFPSKQYGLIMDPLLMLDQVFGSDDVEADDSSKEWSQESNRRLQQEQKQPQSRLSISRGLGCFTRDKCRWQRIGTTPSLTIFRPDHKVWKAGGEGIHNHIVMQLNLLHLSILQDIGHVLGHGPKRQLLLTPNGHASDPNPCFCAFHT
jgi:hypothetical protein